MASVPIASSRRSGISQINLANPDNYKVDQLTDEVANDALTPMYLTQYDIVQDSQIEVPFRIQSTSIENKLVIPNCRITTEIPKRVLRYNSENDFIKNQ